MKKLIINQMNTELNEIKENHWGILIKHLKEIEQLEAWIKEKMSTLMDLKSGYPWLCLQSLDNKSRNNEFKKSISKVDASFPTLCLKPIDREKVYTLIGLSSL